MLPQSLVNPLAGTEINPYGIYHCLYPIKHFLCVCVYIRLRFFDEVARDTLMDLGSSVDRDQLHNFVPAAIAHKNLQLMGLTIHCEEFPEEQRLSASTSPESDRWGKEEGGNAFDKMASSPDMPPQHDHHEVEGKKSARVLKDDGQELLASCIIGECSGKQEIKLKIKQNEQISGPKVRSSIHDGQLNQD